MARTTGRQPKDAARGASSTLQLLISKPAPKGEPSAGPRFPDLPPDVRLVVYRHLLIRPKMSPSDVQVWPAMLSTCKQIHAEAERILYAENTFAVKLSIARENPSPHFHRQTVLGGRGRDYRSCPRGHVFRSFIWPEAPRKARNLTVEIKVRNASLELNRLAINHALVGLFLLLDAASSIRTLELVLLDHIGACATRPH